MREDLNRRAQRALAVLRPLKVVIENYPEGRVEEVEAINNPEDPSAGTRRIPFSRVLYIEQDDFMETPPKKFFRLSPGTEVRLRYAYILKCERVVKDASGAIVELRCTLDPESLNGSTAARRVKGTIHWVSAAHARDAEVRLYDRLFHVGGSRRRAAAIRFDDLNPEFARAPRPARRSNRSLASARRRHALSVRAAGLLLRRSRFAPGQPVFNRTVTLKDSLGEGFSGERHVSAVTLGTTSAQLLRDAAIASGFSRAVRSAGHGRRHVQFESPTVAG